MRSPLGQSSCVLTNDPMLQRRMMTDHFGKINFKCLVLSSLALWCMIPDVFVQVGEPDLRV